MTKQNKKIAISAIIATLLTIGAWLVVGIGFLLYEMFGFYGTLATGLTVVWWVFAFAAFMDEGNKADKRGELE